MCYVHEQLQAALERNSRGQFLLYGRASSWVRPVEVLCRACNSVFVRSPNQLLINSNCPVCEVHAQSARIRINSRGRQSQLRLAF